MVVFLLNVGLVLSGLIRKYPSADRSADGIGLSIDYFRPVTLCPVLIVI
jgi:hypothetical protein